MDKPSVLSGLLIRTVADASPDLVVAAFAAGFAGYQVPIAMTAAQLDARVRSENLDPYASCLFLAAGEPVALLLVNRRGWTSRVGAMGIAPAMRGTGLGTDVMQRAVSDARARGDARLVLEVIQDNERAVKLYRRAGFDVVRPLWGFSIDGGIAEPALPALEIDPAAGAWHAGRHGMVDQPWQLQLPSLAALVRPTRCFIDPSGAIVAMVDATRDTVRLRALSFDRGLSPTASVAFTASLRAVFPGRPWTAPPLFTDAHRIRFFTPAGWSTEDLRQFEMAHPLHAG